MARRRKADDAAMGFLLGIGIIVGLPIAGVIYVWNALFVHDYDHIAMRHGVGYQPYSQDRIEAKLSNDQIFEHLEFVTEDNTKAKLALAWSEEEPQQIKNEANTLCKASREVNAPIGKVYVLNYDDQIILKQNCTN